MKNDENRTFRRFSVRDHKNEFEHWKSISLMLGVYDFVAVNMAYFFGLWLRFDCRFSAIPPEYLTAWEHFIPIYSVFCIAVFWFLRLYRSLWRFASFSELIRVIASSVITAKGVTSLPVPAEVGMAMK